MSAASITQHYGVYRNKYAHASSGACVLDSVHKTEKQAKARMRRMLRTKLYRFVVVKPVTKGEV